MKISYNWLKSYIPEAPSPEELVDVFTFHICEVESFDKLSNGDVIFDVKILPNRAHDLLSHQGVARELSSVLGIKFIDPTPKYRIPESKATNLKIEIKSDKCRRYMGRIVRNVKVCPSPKWVVEYLESIGQRSINNIVDAANIVMFDCGQPVHAFDLTKTKEKLIIRQAEEGERLLTLDGRDWKLKALDLVIADFERPLVVAGIKGGKFAEVDSDTKDIILEVANFDPTSIRKTAQSFNIVTDAKKRFENDLSPELGVFAMKELSALIWDMCPEAIFEEIVDVYPKKTEQKYISVSVDYINKRLGSNFSKEEVGGVWRKLNFEYKEKNNEFEIKVPFLRVDITGPHDLAEDIISILGYDRLEEKLPEIKTESKVNETFAKMLSAREKLLKAGYSEVMTYVFRDSGEVEVLASASDKKFLRANLSDGLKESFRLNQSNASLLEMIDVKIFEIGTIFKKSGEEIHVAYADKKEIKEMTLDEFLPPPRPTGTPPLAGGEEFSPRLDKEGAGGGNLKFQPWSLFPFITRDIAVWVKDKNDKEKLKELFVKNGTELLIRQPYVFDSFTNTKDGRTSFAFRLVFQSYDRTLLDEEVNKILNSINEEIKKNSDWQVR